MARELRIGSRLISDDQPAYVIAEVGHNHQGNLDLAQQLVAAAARAGADAVKLQKRDNRTLFTRAAYDAPYSGNNAFGPTYGEHREFLEFGRGEYRALAMTTAAEGLDFFATAFDAPSADFLAKFGVPAIKMASGDITNTPLLDYVASLHIPMIVSTGTAEQRDVDRAVATIDRHHDKLAILQCTAEYPVPANHLNLAVLGTYRRRYPSTVIGLSYHGDSALPALLAYGLGARIFEVHFTLNQWMRGSDHNFSMEPATFRRLVADLADTHRMLGTSEKHQLPGEKKAVEKMGKSIYAARPISAGVPITIDDLCCKSPGGGIPPYQLDLLIGLTSSVNIQPDEPIVMATLVGTPVEPGHALRTG